MKNTLNPELKVGDKIICYHMEGETSVSPGTTGTVKHIGRDPFDSNETIISVQWDNGSTLSLLSSTDAWKIMQQESIQENINEDSNWKFITENPDIFDNFDWKWLREFLYKIRDSGIINMFGAAPLLYSGKDHIDRYYGEGKEEDEKFQAVLEDADKAKDKIVEGVVNYMLANNKDLGDMDKVNNYARHFSQKIVGLYIALSGFRQ